MKNTKKEETMRKIEGVHLASAIVFLSMLLLSTAPRSALGANINGCATINDSSTLTANIPFNGTVDTICLLIAAHNVVLDGAGYTISANATGKGIQINPNLNNITIQNLTVSNTTFLINLDANIDNVTVDNVRLNNYNGGETVGGYGYHLTLKNSVISQSIGATNCAIRTDSAPGLSRTLINNTFNMSVAGQVCLTGAINSLLQNNTFIAPSSMTNPFVYIYANASNVTLLGNTFTGGTKQVRIENATQISVSGNTFTPSAAQTYALSLYLVPGTTLANNIFSGNSLTALIINQSNTTLLQNNTINSGGGTSYSFQTAYSPFRYNNKDYNATIFFSNLDSLSDFAATSGNTTLTTANGVNSYNLMLGYINSDGLSPNSTYYVWADSGFNNCDDVIGMLGGSVCDLFITNVFIANGASNNYIDNISNKFNSTFNLTPGSPALGLRSVSSGTIGGIVMQNSCGTILNENVFNATTIQDTSTGCTQTLNYTTTSGKVTWGLSNLTILSQLVLGQNLFLNNNLIGVTIDSNLAALNVSAQIQFNNLTYAVPPALLRDGVRCDTTSTCNISYNATSGTLAANISGFSNYTTAVASIGVSVTAPVASQTYNGSLTINVTTSGTTVANVSYLLQYASGTNFTGWNQLSNSSGTQWNTVTNATNSITAANVVVRINATNADTYNDTVNVTFNLDNILRVNITSPIAGQWYRGNLTVNVTVTGPVNAVSHRYFYSNGTAVSGWGPLSNTSATQWSITDTTNGIDAVNATVRINATNAYTYNDTVNMIIHVDNSAPNISFTNVTNTNTTASVLLITASDALSGISLCNYSGAGSGNLTQAVGSNYTANLSGLTMSTTYNLTIICSDVAGNSGNTSLNFTTMGDTTPPNITYINVTNITTTTGILLITVTDSLSTVVSCNYTGAGTGNLTNTTATNYTANLSSLTANTLYNVNVTCSDTVGNANTTTTNFTTSTSTAQDTVNYPSSGGSPLLLKGGDGISIPSNWYSQRQTVVFSSLGRGENKIVFNRENLPLTTIIVTLASENKEVKVTASGDTNRPVEVSEPEGRKIYRYLTITHTNLQESTIAGAGLTFSVDKTWFAAQKGVAKGNIVLMRYANGEWKELPTKIVKGDDTRYFYEAQSPGLSVFLITTKLSTPPPAQPVVALPKEQTPPPQESPAAPVDEIFEEQVRPENSDANTEQETTTSKRWVLVPLAILLVVVGGFVVYLRKKAQ